MPRPVRRIFSPFFKLLAIISITWVSISLAWRLGSSWASESCSARWRSVRTDAVPAADAFVAAAALAVAFGAAALPAVFAGTFAACPDAFAAVLEAGVFLAGAFVDETLVAVLAIRNSFSWDNSLHKEWK
jgi:hypothetical protein